MPTLMSYVFGKYKIKFSTTLSLTQLENIFGFVKPNDSSLALPQHNCKQAAKLVFGGRKGEGQKL